MLNTTIKHKNQKFGTEVTFNDRRSCRKEVRKPRTVKAKAEAVETTETVVAEKPKTTRARKTTKAAKAQQFQGTGRRKCSVARVRVTTGTGSIKVNGVD